jgi:hypothetical protein
MIQVFFSLQATGQHVVGRIPQIEECLVPLAMIPTGLWKATGLDKHQKLWTRAMTH